MRQQLINNIRDSIGYDDDEILSSLSEQNSIKTAETDKCYIECNLYFLLELLSYGFCYNTFFDSKIVDQEEKDEKEFKEEDVASNKSKSPAAADSATSSSSSSSSAAAADDIATVESEDNNKESHADATRRRF